MIKDITYCSHQTCIHRYGCERSLSNYELPQDKQISVFDGTDCADNVEDRYCQLKRFRPSWEASNDKC